MLGVSYRQTFWIAVSVMGQTITSRMGHHWKVSWALEFVGTYRRLWEYDVANASDLSTIVNELIKTDMQISECLK